MFKLPYPEPDNEHQAVANGIALFEHNGVSVERVRFLIAQDIEHFDMADACNCVVGRTVGWAEHWDALIDFDNHGMFADDQYGFDVGDTYWTYGDLQRAWCDALSLPLVPWLARSCVYIDTDNHSDDLIAVHHGMPDGRPTYICGFHEESRGIPQGDDRHLLDKQHPPC